MNVKLFFVLLSLLLFIIGCSQDYSQLAGKRLEIARKGESNISVVAMNDSTQFINGVLLAAEIINNKPGKLLDRKLEIIIEEEKDSFEEIKPTINRVIANPNVVAVLGHRRSAVAVPASAIYESAQVVFISSFSTSKSLTGHNFKYTFRFVPANEEMVAQLANASSMFGYQRIVSLYSRDDYHRELAFLFEDAAIKEGLKLVKRSSFFAKDDNYRPVISEFTDEDFDAIFIAAGSESSGKMAKQLREMGLTAPIIGTDSLNSQNYIRIAGSNAANGTIVPAIYDLDNKNIININFKEKYYRKYDIEPDYNAVQGYDAMMLLASAISKTGSTLGPSLSSTLHFMSPWIGATGIHSYDQNGELFGKRYILKTWRENRLEILPALHSAYLLKRFERSIGSKDFRLSNAFSKLKHDADHKILMLDLAHEILNFQNIGIIYEDTPNGRQLANQDLVKELADKKNITIHNCIIPFSLLDKKRIQQFVIDCYGKLSLEVDILLAPSKRNIPPDLLSSLGESLKFFKIPTLSIDDKTMTPQTTLGLRYRTDINKRNVSVYNGLLHDTKNYEFFEKIRGIPDITVNILDLEKFGKSLDEIVLLSPDKFILPNDANGYNDDF